MGQTVTLNLDGTNEALSCVVAAVEGPLATLVHTTQTAEEVAGRLTGGVAGFLVLAGSAGAVGLRGAAIVTPETEPLIEFLITDQG